MANSDTLSAAAAAVLCDDFIQAVESYFLWDRMKTPPHQVGTLEGILIGDFGATAEVYEARRTRAAVWIRDNGPTLAAALAGHGFKPLSVLRIVGFIDDPDAVPSGFHGEWKQIKARLQQAAIRLRKNKRPAPGAGFPFTRDSYPLREVARDLEALQEGYSLEQPEARAAHRSEGFARLETFCLTEAGEFTPAVLRKLCAVAARKTGKTLRDVLSLAIVPGLELLERYATSKADTSPGAVPPKQGEGNGATPPAAKRKRGRRADTDPKADKKVADAWATHHHKTYADLERELKMKKGDVKRALDRHRHRVK